MVWSDTIIRDDSQAGSPSPSVNTVFLFCNTNNNPLNFCSPGCQGEDWAALQIGRHQFRGQNTPPVSAGENHKRKKMPASPSKGLKLPGFL